MATQPFLFLAKETGCPLPPSISASLLRVQTSPFKTRWLIIYPGNEMPKPEETYHQERKGHSHPAHGYNTLTQQWWMAITSLSALQADSFHADVLIASKSKGRAKTRGEIFRRALKKLWFLNPHSSVCVCSIVNCNLSLRWKQYVHALTPESLRAQFSWRVFVWLNFDNFVHVSLQLHDTASQMGCQCCRMIKRWEVFPLVVFLFFSLCATSPSYAVIVLFVYCHNTDAQ